MTKPPFAFLALLAAWCAGCDAKSPLDPSPVASAPSPRFTVHQTSAQPGDGETLAYGQSGRVEIAYTPGLESPAETATGYPIGLPGQFPPAALPGCQLPLHRRLKMHRQRIRCIGRQPGRRSVEHLGLERKIPRPGGSDDLRDSRTHRDTGWTQYVGHGA